MLELTDPKSASSGRAGAGAATRGMEARDTHGPVPQMPRGVGTARRWPLSTSRQLPCWQQSQPKPGWPRWMGLQSQS